MYYWIYKTKDNYDDIILYSNGDKLEGLDFLSENSQKITSEEKLLPVFEKASKWLDIYFSGHQPSFDIEMEFRCTDFQMNVYDILLNIPFGQYRTYGNIAEEIARNKGFRKMSAQAVGQAVGANPIAIIVPCHRVLGANRKLTGYSGGISNKIALLENENIPYTK